MESVPTELGDAFARLVRERLGVAALRIVPLRAGLGTRRFFRIHTDNGARGAPATLVARVEAPATPASVGGPEPALEPLRTHLERAGLPVPRSFGSDAALGIDLLEDLGERSLQSVFPELAPEERRALYEETCDHVACLQRVDEPSGGLPAFGRRLDADFFEGKARLFVEWSLAEALGRPASAAEVAAVDEAFGFVAEQARQAPARLAHRDLQSSNLFLVSPAGSRPRLKWLDFQGAFLAPPEYDLMCLLRDSYVELDAAELAHHLERTRPRLPDAPDADTFRLRFDLLTLTRKSKDHALFVRAARLRGEPGYRRFLPGTIRSLLGAAERCAPLHPCLARLAELLETLR